MPQNYQGTSYKAGAWAFQGPVTVQGSLITQGTTLIAGQNAAYPLSALGPSGSGIKAWSFPNYLATGTASAVSVTGSVYLSQVNLSQGVTYSNIYLRLQANGGTAVATNFAGLYNSAGQLVATTGDLSGALGTNQGTTGYITCPLTSAYTPGAAGPYWVGVQFNFTNAGSYPTFNTLTGYATLATSAGKTATGVAAPNGTQPYPFAAIATVGTGSLPPTFTLTNAGTTGAYVYWAGLA